MISDDRKTVSTLFGNVAELLAHLVKTEVRLAQTELRIKIEEAGTGIAYVTGGVVFMIPAVVVSLIALAIWLIDMGLAPAFSYLIAGVTGGALGGALLSIGLGRLKPKHLRLSRTTEQVSRDIAAARRLT